MYQKLFNKLLKIEIRIQNNNIDTFSVPIRGGKTITFWEVEEGTEYRLDHHRR